MYSNVNKQFIYVFVISMLLITGCENVGSSYSLSQRDDDKSNIQIQNMIDSDNFFKDDSNTVYGTEKMDEDIVCILSKGDIGDEEYILNKPNLSLALSYMVHYGLEFDNPTGDPGEDFWKKLVSALIENSCFSPFLEDDSFVFDNEHIASAGSKLVGSKLECHAFSDIAEEFHAYSPYLFNSRNVNIEITDIEDGTYELTYDIMWADSSLTGIYGMKRVKAVIMENDESPLDGCSIIYLDHDIIYDPVTILDVEFEVDHKSCENEEYYEAYYRYEGTDYTVLIVGHKLDNPDKYYVKSRHVVSYEKNIEENIDMEISEMEYEQILIEIMRNKT